MVAAAVVAGAVIAGGATIYGANKAAGAQSDAAAAGAAAQLQMYNQTRADLAPYRQTGYEALGALSDLFLPGQNGQAPDYSAFYESPGYQFRFNEGLRALDQSASARGVLQSGAYGRELQRYGQGMASGEFNNYANRLAALAGIGQTATNTTAQAGLATGQGVANNLITAGTARASGYVGAGNAISQQAGNAANNYMMYNYLNQGGGPTAAQAGYANAYGNDFYAY